MDRKLTNLAALLVGTLFVGILLGRYCFPQSVQATLPNPNHDNGGTMESQKNAQRQFATENAKHVGGKSGVKGSVPESAADRLAKFMAGHPNINERCDFVKQLITELCSEGRDEEAYALIDPNSGQLRAIGMFSFYSSARLDKNRLMGMVKREAFHDLLPAFHGYMRGFGIDQLKAEAESSRLADFRRERGADMPSDLIECAIAETLASRLAEAGHLESLDAIKLASDLAEDGAIKSYQIYEIVGKDKNLDPFEKWEFLKPIDPMDAQQGDQAIKVKIREKLIDSMIRADGGKAMGEILNHQSPSQASDVTAAVRVWNALDPAGVTGWFQQNQSILSPGGKTLVATTLSTVAAEYGEFDSARQWANQIQDPLGRAEALKLVDEKAANHRKWLDGKQ